MAQDHPDKMAQDHPDKMAQGHPDKVAQDHPDKMADLLWVLVSFNVYLQHFTSNV